LASFYLDACINPKLGDELQKLGHATATSRSAGLALDAPDPRQLLESVRRNAIFLSHDAGFLSLHDAWHRWSREWGVAPWPPALPPILLFPHYDPRRAPLWLLPYAAGQLDAFVAGGQAVYNSIHQWKPAIGHWVATPYKE
jgi:hypothetical protein